jgi:hypothetical protein
LRDIAAHYSSGNAAYIRRHTFEESVELTSYPHASGPWYSERQIHFLIWQGDLVIDGDLIDDDFENLPLLIVRGNLTVRNWLRGGMPGFVAGDVRAAGFIIGHYNDSVLFVGGALTATGYVPCVKPFPDYPEVVPHQIAGKVDARLFDVASASPADVKAAFVDDVLVEEGEDTWVDERAVIHQFRDGLPVWR